MAVAAKPRVYTTIYPLYDFTRNIGGQQIDLRNITPSGGDPHHWEPSPKDIAELSRADVIIYCGTGIESWLDKVLPAIDQSKVVLVNAAEGIELLGASARKDHSCSKSSDPHIWLDPLNAMIMVENIVAGLSGADREHADLYKDRGLKYKQQLEQLDRDYTVTLAELTNREFVVSHEAFGYLANRYNLKQIPIRRLSPELESGPAVMAEVVKYAREKQFKYIFFESMANSKVSENLARELKAETLVLDTLEGLNQDRINSGQDYIYIMRQNLANLKVGLGVK